MSTIMPAAKAVKLSVETDRWLTAATAFNQFLIDGRNLFSARGVLAVEKLDIFDEQHRNIVSQPTGHSPTRAMLNEAAAIQLKTGLAVPVLPPDYANFLTGPNHSVVAGFGISSKRTFTDQYGNRTRITQLSKAIPFEILGMIIATLRTAEIFGITPIFLIGDKIGEGNPDLQHHQGLEALRLTKDYYISALKDIIAFLKPALKVNHDYQIVDGRHCEKDGTYTYAYDLVKDFHAAKNVADDPRFAGLTHHDWDYFWREAATLLTLTSDGARIKISWDNDKISERMFDEYFKEFRIYLLNNLSDDERQELNPVPLACLYTRPGSSMDIDGTKQFVGVSPYYVTDDMHGRMLLTQRDGKHDCLEILRKKITYEDGTFITKAILPNGKLKNQTLAAMVENTAAIIQCIEEMSGKQLAFDKARVKKFPENVQPFAAIMAKADTIANQLNATVDCDWELQNPEFPDPQSFLGLVPGDMLDAGCPKSSGDIYKKGVKTWAWEAETQQRQFRNSALKKTADPQIMHRRHAGGHTGGKIDVLRYRVNIDVRPEAKHHHVPPIQGAYL